MVPVAVLDFALEGQQCAHAGVVAGKKQDMLAVLSVLESVVAAARPVEALFRRVDGDPLEIAVHQQLDGLAVAARDGRDVVALFPAGDALQTVQALFLRGLFDESVVADHKAIALPGDLVHMLFAHTGASRSGKVVIFYRKR